MSLDSTQPCTALGAATIAAVARARLDAAPSSRIFHPARGQAMAETEAAAEAIATGNSELVDEFMLGRSLRRAAVLVGIVARDEPTVLLTQRTDQLPSHAGQIAFPGGKLEPGDADAIAAAVREAGEEIGLSGGFIEPIGYLDALRTHTGFHIDPVVALVQPGFALRLDAREVADVFEVPLTFLMDPANHRRLSRVRDGRRRSYYAMPYQQRFIWGATAAMIKNLQLRLFP